MMTTRLVLWSAASLASVNALDNGLALTPPMGWNPWNCFGVGHTGQCKLPLPWVPGHPTTAGAGGCHGFNESVILTQARIMAEKLKPFGWQYMSLDCGWSTKRRGADGALVVNETRYPHGMQWLGDELHKLGLKFGMYGAQGTSQCCSKIDPHASDGSLGFYDRDANLFASWGVDYLKFDGCGGPKSSIDAMKKALNATGRPIAYSINNGVQTNNSNDANLWRTTGDIDNTYDSVINRAFVNNNATSIVKGQPGAWNDADMLEVGNLFSDLAEAEERTHFALWCLMKSPLVLGTDLTNLTDVTLKIITTPGAIAISQDPLGEQGLLRQSSCYKPASKHDQPSPCGYQVWSGALTGNKATAVLANLDTSKALINLQSEHLPASRNTISLWDITDVYSDTVVCKGCKLPQSVTVGPHDVAFWTLSPASL